MKKFKQVLLLSLLLPIFAGSFALAQSAVRGTVKDAVTGEPLPFINVFIKGTTTGTYTLENGTYTINVAPNATLVFSSIGYTSVEQPVSNRSVIDVSLQPDSFTMDEIVMVAYGTQKRQDLTSSIATVKGEELMKAPVASMNEAMQGKMAGVQISSASGTPGGAINVRIRGSSSLTAGNDPLYVVDGMPITVTDYSQMAFGGQTTNPLASINPSDIENVQVLKDAAAAALYGSRASNGVILITTKRGKAQQATVTFDTSYGVQNLWRELNWLNTEQWLTAQNEARANNNAQRGLSPGQAGYINPITAEVPGTDTDWMKVVSRENPMLASMQIGVSGGTETTQFYLSAGYFTQQGLIKKSEYDRYTFKANISHKFSDKVKIDFNTNFSTSDNNRVYGDNNIYAPWMSGARNRPDQPVYDPTSSTGYYRTIRNNPVACFDEMDVLNRNQRLMGNFTFEWKIIDNLVFTSKLNADFTYIHETSKFSTAAPQAQLYQDEARDYSTYINKYLVENILNYSRTFGNTNASILVGQSFQQDQITRSNVSATGFVSNELKWIESASKPSGYSSSFREFLMESYFGRLSFNIDDRYLIEGTIRSDASSKFAKNRRVGVFPSGSLGWRLSNESFFPTNNVLTDVKVRGSIGLTGNQEGIGYHGYMPLYSVSGYDEKGSIAPSTTAANPDLTWEKTLQTDIGIDLAFLNGRMEFTYDYFIKDTRDLLLSRAIPITTGNSSMMQNIGKVKTTGHEISFFTRNIVKPDFRWNTSFNISFIDNKVTELAKNPQGGWEEFNTGNRSRIVVGYPVSTFYVIKAIGIYQNDSDVPTALYNDGIRAGDVIYEDFNNDGRITADDRQPYRSGSPTVYGGLTNTLSFKGFDMELGMQYSLGNWIYTYWKEADGAGNGGRSNYQVMADHWENRWTPTNKHNDPNYPRFVYGSSVAQGSLAATHNTQASTSRWLQDGSFLRIKSVIVGYTLPTKISRKINLDRIRVYANIQNLYTFTKYDGYDPEIEHNPAATAERSVDFMTVPQLRSFTFGLNLSF